MSEFEMVLILLLVASVAEAACKAAKKESLAPQLAQEAGMTLTAYLEWQRWKARVRNRAAITVVVALGCGVLTLIAASLGTAAMRDFFLLCGVCGVSGAGVSYLWARDREAALRPPVLP